MQKRSYSARRISVTEKPGRLSGFSSLQSCSSQPEENETDEPPSLFSLSSTGNGLYRLSRIIKHHLGLANSQPLLFQSKNHMPEEGKGFFFFATGHREKSFCDFADFFDPAQRGNSPLAGSESADKATAASIPGSLIRLKRAAYCFEELQEEGFILRDNRGRIKTIIFNKKRSI